MKQLFPRLGARAYVLLMAVVTAAVWGQVDSSRDQLIQQMLAVVLENNPTLASQAQLLRETESLRPPRSRVALTGMSFTFATSVWDSDTDAFRLYPAATLGASISIADPARALNSFNLAKGRVEAQQGQQELRNGLITDLMSAVREILKLAGRRESLEKLKASLQDHSSLIERQVRAGVATPEMDRLWELRERLLGIDAELVDVASQLDTLSLEAALRLAGDAWPQLQELLEGLGRE